MAEIQVTSPDDHPFDEANSAPSILEHVSQADPNAVILPTESVPQAVDEASGDEDRWDHDKAETLATALKETGVLDDELQKRQAKIDYRNSDESFEERTSEERASLEEAERRLSSTTAQDNPSSFSIERATGVRDERQAALDEKTEQLRQSNERYVGDSLKEVNETVGEELSPYEELYDVNPEHFASMPTGEFMKLAERYREICYKLNAKEVMREYVDETHSRFQAMPEQKRLATVDDIDEMARYVSSVLSADQYDEIKSRYHAVSEGDYDKTKRQIMEALLALDEEYLAQIDSVTTSLKTEKDNFLDQFRPNPSN